ncbi:MAG: hypothetical protein U0529_09905 [Thermoanaerobaculia bacterium]
MRRPTPASLAVPLLAAALFLAAPADGKTTKKKKSHAPAPTPTPRPYYGPPAPTPEPLLRAAGACMEFTPGQHIVVAEVGATGRVFRVNADTRIEADVRKGARVRVLYVDGPEGPVARKVLPGPAGATPPTPSP